MAIVSRMSDNTRKGLGLLAIAAALWIVSLGGDNPFMEVVSGAAVLFALGGLLVAALGLLRD